MRTLGAVGGRFQALSNGGFELRLRIWSPPCGGVLYAVYMVGVRVRVRIISMCRVRATVAVSARLGHRVTFSAKVRVSVRGRLASASG